MSIISTGVEAESFNEAIAKLKKNDKLKILVEDEKSFNYSIPQVSRFHVTGRMENKPLKII